LSFSRKRESSTPRESFLDARFRGHDSLLSPSGDPVSR
jgi:hypothetical protein